MHTHFRCATCGDVSADHSDTCTHPAWVALLGRPDRTIRPEDFVAAHPNERNPQC